MKKIAIAAVLSAFVAAPVLAENAYVGLSAGQNKMDVSGAKSSTAFSIFGGYSFNEYIAGELAYADFGSADTDTAGVSIKGNAMSIAAVGSWPLPNAFSLYARLGYASSKAEQTGGTSETKDDLTYGIGAQYDATRNVGLRLGYDNYRVGKDNTKDSGMMSIAALFKF